MCVILNRSQRRSAHFSTGQHGTDSETADKEHYRLRFQAILNISIRLINESEPAEMDIKSTIRCASVSLAFLNNCERGAGRAVLEKIKDSQPLQSQPIL